MSEFNLVIDFNTGLIAIAALLLLNGLLAMAETALLSVRKARLHHEKNEGNLRAGAVLKLIENPNQFLSVIQIGITTIDLLIGALTGATLGVWINAEMDKYPALAPYSGMIGILVGILPVTYLSLVLGELVPKRLAMRSPEKLSALVAGPMRFFGILFSPFVRLLSFSTETILRLLGVRPSTDPPVTEEELQVLLDQGTQAGVFEESEQDMIQGVFSIGDQRVYSLMTPRTEIVWLEVNDSVEQIRKKIADSSYSRFPVRDGTLENVVGVVRARDLLLANLAGEKLNLRNNLHPAIYIPETALASQALEMFKGGKAELMLVVDEFGAVQGLITLNDILSEIVEGIGTDEPVATQRQDGSWLLDGMLPVDDFKEIFNVREMPEEEGYETLGGFVMYSLGRIPQASEKFEWNGLTFEVMDMDARRVDKVLVTVTKNKPAATSAGEEPKGES
jgi:putative hemolysin